MSKSKLLNSGSSSPPTMSEEALSDSDSHGCCLCCSEEASPDLYSQNFKKVYGYGDDDDDDDDDDDESDDVPDISSQEWQDYLKQVHDNPFDIVHFPRGASLQPIKGPVYSSTTLIELAKMAINKFNKDEGEKYAFRSIEKALGRDFSTDYFITFKADDGKGGTKTFQTKAFSRYKFAGVYSVVMKEEASSDLYSQNYKIALKNQFQILDPDPKTVDSHLQDALDESDEELDPFPQEWEDYIKQLQDNPFDAVHFPRTKPSLGSPKWQSKSSTKMRAENVNLH